MSDPDGSYTIANLDDHGIDAAIVLPVDYDLTFGEESTLSIDEKHQHLGEIQRKYPGRIVAMAGPDPREPTRPNCSSGLSKSTASRA